MRIRPSVTAILRDQLEQRRGVRKSAPVSRFLPRSPAPFEIPQCVSAISSLSVGTPGALAGGGAAEDGLASEFEDGDLLRNGGIAKAGEVGEEGDALPLTLPEADSLRDLEEEDPICVCVCEIVLGELVLGSILAMLKSPKTSPVAARKAENAKVR